MKKCPPAYYNQIKCSLCITAPSTFAAAQERKEKEAYEIKKSGCALLFSDVCMIRC